eukprot:469781-Rhodomonas_salina.3
MVCWYQAFPVRADLGWPPARYTLVPAYAHGLQCPVLTPSYLPTRTVSEACSNEDRPEPDSSKRRQYSAAGWMSGVRY